MRQYDPAAMALPVELVDPVTFWELPEYSLSVPTGTRPGRRWRRWIEPWGCPSGWLIGEYSAIFSTPDGDRQRIDWYRVVFTDAPDNAAIYRYGSLYLGWSAHSPTHNSILSTTLTGLISGLDRLSLPGGR